MHAAFDQSLRFKVQSCSGVWFQRFKFQAEPCSGGAEDAKTVAERAENLPKLLEKMLKLLKLPIFFETVISRKILTADLRRSTLNIWPQWSGVEW